MTCLSIRTIEDKFDAKTCADAKHAESRFPEYKPAGDGDIANNGAVVTSSWPDGRRDA